MRNNANSSEANSVEHNNSTPAGFINEAECLRRVPVSRRTWFSWRLAGKVPTIKCGRRSLYHWPSVEAALLRMQRGGNL
jgi:hypothetical protein